MSIAPFDGTPGTLTLRGRVIPTVTRDVEVSRLRFYLDNPRIYSSIRSDGGEPSQDEIERRLLDHDHVKHLIQDIPANGGLIDPLVVRDDDMVVLEGNSRLAAYRHLCRQDALRWGSARCTILPGDIDDRSVFALLAQYHLKGKKDWLPYEKAGFVHRRFTDQKVDLAQIAVEIGTTRDEAKHLVAVYQFMLDHGDVDRSRWSHYDELLKSRKIRKVREEIAGFDDFIVDQIKTGQIKAVEVRDKLPAICTGSQKTLKRYIGGKVDLEEAHDAVVLNGGENPSLGKLKRFKKWIVEGTTEEDLLDAPKNVRDVMHYELKLIEQRCRKLKDLIEARKFDLDKAGRELD